MLANKKKSLGNTEKKCKTDHIIYSCFNLSTGFQSWKRIEYNYKINTLCYSTKCYHWHCSVLSLCDHLQLYTPSHSLHSASDTLSLQIPRTRLSAVWFPHRFCILSSTPLQLSPSSPKETFPGRLEIQVQENYIYISKWQTNRPAIFPALCRYFHPP